MTDLTITCPQCACQIELTEALAAPLVQDLQQEFALRMDQKDRAVAERERRVGEHERRNREQQALIEERMAEREAEIREELATKARRAARAEVAIEAEETKQIIDDLKERLALREEKAEQAVQERAALRKKELDLDERTRELENEVQGRLSAELPALIEKANEQARKELAPTIAQQNEQLEQQRKRIDELQRNSHQGSQQVQGAANETAIHSLLEEAFPQDIFEKVKTGARGGDLRQTVCDPTGGEAGHILFEVKQAKTFQKSWVDKLLQDRSQVAAEVAVLISPVLPNGCRSFMHHNGIWMVTPDLAADLVVVLRSELLGLARLKRSMTGRESKSTQLFDYLQGPIFRNRVSELVTAAVQLRERQDRMRDMLSREFARSEAQILRIRTACMGIQGDIIDAVGEDIATIDADSFEKLGYDGDG